MIHLVCLIKVSFDKPQDQNNMNPTWHQNSSTKSLPTVTHAVESGSSGLQVISDDVDPVVLTQTCALHRCAGLDMVGHRGIIGPQNGEKLTAKHRHFGCFFGKRHGKWLRNNIRKEGTKVGHVKGADPIVLTDCTCHRWFLGLKIP